MKPSTASCTPCQPRADARSSARRLMPVVSISDIRALFAIRAPSLSVGVPGLPLDIARCAEPELAGDGCGLSPGVHVQLRQQLRHVVAGGLLADEQMLR